MEFKISQEKAPKTRLFIISEAAQLKNITGLTDAESAFALSAVRQQQVLTSINKYDHTLHICCVSTNAGTVAEQLRLAGVAAEALLVKEKAASVSICNLSAIPMAAYYLAEGITLAAYRFLKYKTDIKKLLHPLKNISFDPKSITLKDLGQLKVVTDAVSIARNLVNEPLNALGAEQLAKEIALLGKTAGFKVTTLRKTQLLKEKMGGLLAVNRGSIDPPTFSIMEYKPAKTLNKQPIVLVGKGIVYDTGGLSLKPTPNSMDRMKSDMSGAALVTAAMYAAAMLKLPLHLVALVPATDNRPGENAYVPGDVITMYDGSTVEVLNTDAEGRMVLADALHWAKRYKPELVIDFATLTGAASAMTGEHAMVYMGTAGDKVKAAFENSGYRQHERMVQVPLWEEYAAALRSEIADMKNVGGAQGGAITAGKFLERFTAYPWLHFDIAGVSFATARRHYQAAGGTAFGLRMLIDYLAGYGK